ncbi:Major facilitator superfamily [Cynara cardunculus var. scolymus]|uniref:Major facilitator superfamily n=1 Tax=Cynara cardunculus var. scolymus TaxID=59895 RepID=A0A103XRC3_CYNCS|nr:Major facilitator superfamily [Cynara cardunculus var. scolymus]
MVAFGKKLKDRQIEEWKGYYINYKLMKKKVKQYARQIEAGGLERRYVLKDFSRMLDNQIEKIVLFLLEQQGLLASRLDALGKEQDALQEEPDFSRISDLREAYREVGRDLLKLLFFVEVNAIGLRKILKKFDKRFGYRFTDYYVKTRANHPYSQLQQVFKHVEPVIDTIRAAVDRLSYSTNFLTFLGQHALIMQEELPMPTEEPVDDQRYHFMSLLLNLANTFLYMVNTYIIVPTADDYSMSLGAAATVCGIVIGAMAVAQIFSSVYFSAWSNRSYFRPLIFSSIVLFMGNVMYAMAYDFNSIAVLLLGRLFCGLGSARAVNRRYISDCVPLKIRMQASAGFVSASALGMACGPALAGLLQVKFKIYKLTINQNTLPGWVMAFACSEAHQDDEEDDPECDASEETSEDSRAPVQLLIYFMLKYAMEILLSESSVVTTYYFHWTTGKVAIFLACLGLTVLPIVVCLGILMSFHVVIPYSVPQYVVSGLIMFVSAEVLEGVNLSLLSRVMSSRLSRGTFNGGLLSTEAGTIARVIADATITLAGYLGESKLLNVTLLPSLMICIMSIVATCFTYNSLY